jgi:hypothetical protein
MARLKRSGVDLLEVYEAAVAIADTYLPGLPLVARLREAVKGGK